MTTGVTSRQVPVSQASSTKSGNTNMSQVHGYTDFTTSAIQLLFQQSLSSTILAHCIINSSVTETGYSLPRCNTVKYTTG